MGEVEEPQFMSLQARKAALNQAQAGSQLQTFGKRPPPPIPTSSSNRPSLASRGQTINNPPVSTYGSSVTKQANNEPIGVKTVKSGLLPPPPVDRDGPPQNAVKTPPLPARNTKAPPPLPSRNSSQQSPGLQPRNTSTQLTHTRRGSNSSTLSYSSTISGMSLGQTASSTTSASSTDTQRKLPPSFDQTKLPPLPPTKRELEEKAKSANEARIPMISVKSAPSILRDVGGVEQDAPPKMPPRPTGPPRLPSRPVSRNNNEENAPVQPPRRLPPPALDRPSILKMGFNNKKADTIPTPSHTPEYSRPSPPPTPEYSRPNHSQPTPPQPTRPAVRELTDRDFDSVVMNGTPALVDFYAPYCRYCKELDPIWQELGESFASSPGITIAKVDVNEYKTFMERFDQIQGYPTILFFDGYNEQPEKYQYQRTLEALTDLVTKKTQISPFEVASNPIPPPINMRSKPTSAQLSSVRARTASTQRPVSSSKSASGCLICRDFSGPDRHAAKFPRSSLPKTGDLSAHLASVLCAPFDDDTDKARVIFTWLHHNIAYDTAAFFENRVKFVAPNDTIRTGLGVCGGYAGLLHEIAVKAGLDAIEVNGHGKGYGYTKIGPGESIPKFNMNHAWNAVRFSDGEYKLIDPCWGAGHLDTATKTYTKKFAPAMFTMSNEEFGLTHFPTEENNFFVARPPTYKKYMLGEGNGEDPVQMWGNPEEEHGLSKKSFTPALKNINVSKGNGDEVVRFQFSRPCEHWDHERHLKKIPYLLILAFNKGSGNEKLVPFEQNSYWYWLDVKKKDLGSKGKEVICLAITNFDGKDGRGLTREEFNRKNGKVGCAFSYLSTWKLV